MSRSRRTFACGLALTSWVSAGVACERSNATMPPAAEASRPALCVDPHYRDFDFWIGHWEVRSADGQFAGTNRIEVAHGGCAVMENWSSARGGGGSSSNQWVPATKQWVQHWVDGSGSSIDLRGGLVEGSMLLTGEYLQADGSRQQMRGTWTPLDDGRVRQFFEVSDDGQQWTPWFEGFYSRR